MQTEFQKQYYDYLTTRRTVTKDKLSEPGPSEQEIVQMLTIASRVPDHGKLSPWRFIIYPQSVGVEIGEFLAKRRGELIAGISSNLQKQERNRLTQAPLCIGVISKPVKTDVPEWEQVMASGAVCFNLLQAAYSLGYSAQWLSDWFSFDAPSKKFMGIEADEQVAGFIYVGTAPVKKPKDRPRPDVPSLTTIWSPK
ncbi:MAG: nitroreductase [Alphaproteobacteria bacterium]|nr:nitroreductase [Alphaproteobacteria bacterium]